MSVAGRAWRRVAPFLAGFGASLVLSAAAPATADAQWTAFLPTPYENHAWLETYASWERDNSKGNATGIRWEDTYFREKLSVQSLGYSYDPRFLQYKLTVAGAAKQENYQTSAYSSGGWGHGEGVEYDARLMFLPEHRYNMELFARRYEPVYRQQASNQHDSVLDDYGAVLRYRFKPWFFNADYIDTTQHTTDNRSNVKRLSVEGEYFKRFLQGYEWSVNTAAHPSWYSDSNGLDGTSDDYMVGTLVNLKRVRLDSNASWNFYDQSRTPLDRYNTDQFAWWELLTVYLPWDFRSELMWRRHDDNSVIDDAGPQPARRYGDNGDNVQFDLIHRLYESLDTRYRFVDDSRDSSGGSSELLSHSLTADYTKLVPFGRLLTGATFGRAELDNKGFANVINDPYTATAVPGTFSLHQQDVDPTSIVVMLKSPLPPFDTVTLVEGVHYQVNTAVQPFEIQLIALPAEFVVPGTYDFFVTFSMLSGDYKLRTDTGGANFSVELLGNKVTPFFRYLALRSDVLAGTYPGVPIDSNAYTTGLRLQYGPWRGRGEYQCLDWAANPYRAWRGEVQYIGSLTQTITTYTTLSYMDRHYLGGEAPYTTLDFTERTTTVSGTATKQFYSRNLYLSVGGSYSHLQGVSDSDAWSANSSLVWHIGKLDVTLGLTAYGSNSQTSLNPDFQRDHQMIFLNLRRQLL